MGYFIVGIIFFYIGAKIGVKYQDFQDIMLARRISKMIKQKEAVSKDTKNYDDYAREEEEYYMIDGKPLNELNIQRELQRRTKKRKDLIIEDGDLIDN